MNRILKLTLTITLAVMASLGINAQSFVLQYNYDSSGNRVTRSVVEVQPPQNSPRLMGHSGEVTVSPTVTTDYVTILTTLDPEQPALRYIVNSLQGSVLAMGDITDQQTLVPLSNYDSGIYLLTILSDSGIKSFKIIKQ